MMFMFKKKWQIPEFSVYALLIEEPIAYAEYVWSTV